MVMFFYGFSSHKYKIFPYKILKDIGKKIIHKDNLTVKNQNEEKIRNKYKNWNSHNANLKVIFIKKYYSDRNYFNHKNDKKLEDLYLLQIPRHYKKDIFLETTKQITVYRVLCKKNNNKKYMGWKKESYKLAIIGRSCVHTDIVKKRMERGSVKISAGGPISSDPIFFYTNNLNEKDLQILE